MDTTEQYILRFGGAGPAPADDLERIRASKEITVLDYSPPRMLLVRAPEGELMKLVSELPGWIMTPERRIALPPPYPTAKAARSTKTTRGVKSRPSKKVPKTNTPRNSSEGHP